MLRVQGHFKSQCPNGENVADLTAEVVKALKKLFLWRKSEVAAQPESSKTRETQTLKLEIEEQVPNCLLGMQPNSCKMPSSEQTQGVDAHHSVGLKKRPQQRLIQGKNNVHVQTTEPFSKNKWTISGSLASNLYSSWRNIYIQKLC